MSSQKIKKPKICKCGHSNNTHKKKNKSLLTSYCRECQCSSYMNRIHPTKGDKLAALILPIIFVILTSIVLILWSIGSNLLLENSETKTVPLELFLNIIFAIMIIGIVILGGVLVSDPIVEYIEMKRPSFPIVNNDGTIEEQ